MKIKKYISKLQKRLLVFFFFFLLLCLNQRVLTNPFQVIPSPLPETEIKQIYLNMLEGYVKYAETLWHNWAKRPPAGYFGNGISKGNEGIRATSGTTLAYALLLRETDKKEFSGIPRDIIKEHTIAAIRYIAFTHKTGPCFTTDGKKWGYSWQSSLWASNFGLSAWLIWDQLDIKTKQIVKKVIIGEADRFLNCKPIGNEFLDTKAEENAWNTNITSLAANMFPTHPRAKEWRQKSIEYIMNTLSVKKDFSDNTIVDGKPVKEWVFTINLHPDFTLENHGFFHLVYLMVSAMSLGDSSIYYSFSKQLMPEAIGHHVLDGWETLKHFILPDGEWAYPNGLDWSLHDYEHISYLAWLATYWRDPLAKILESRLVQYSAQRQKINRDGRFVGESVGDRGFFREAVAAKRIVYAYLHHKLQGKFTDKNILSFKNYEKRLYGVRKYNYVDLIIHRTQKKFVSFSWKLKIMGYVVPSSSNYLNNPYITTPYTKGFVGTYEILNKTKEKLINCSYNIVNNGFSTTGFLLSNNARVKHYLSFTSIGDEFVVYMDETKANWPCPINIKGERGIPIGIENDELTGECRLLYTSDGKFSILGERSFSEIYKFNGNWINIDNRLGMIVWGSSGIAYQTSGGYNRRGAKRDLLFGSYSNRDRSFWLNKIINRRGTLILVNYNHKKTREVSNKIDVLNLPEGWAGIIFESLNRQKYLVISNFYDNNENLTIEITPELHIVIGRHISATKGQHLTLKVPKLQTIFINVTDKI